MVKFFFLFFGFFLVFEVIFYFLIFGIFVECLLFLRFVVDNLYQLFPFDYYLIFLWTILSPVKEYNCVSSRRAYSFG